MYDRTWLNRRRVSGKSHAGEPLNLANNDVIHRSGGPPESARRESRSGKES